MNEIWKTIKGYEGLYEVSNLGRIRSLNVKKGRILKLLFDKDNYLIVGLSKNNNRKFYRVHRLVAEAFIPNPENKPCVNHKDECKENNIWTNLEYCTHKYNNTYGNRIKKLKKPIIQYDLSGNFVKEWDGINEAQKTLNITGLSQCCKGKRKTLGGYLWKYKLEEE